MSYLFIGEGSNDELVVPIILDANGCKLEQSDFKTWKSLHARGLSGFKKKAILAIKIARLQGLNGLVATLDADDQPDRIDKLKEARCLDRSDPSNTHLPIVVGQANPLLEAWLLDDHNAVKTGLNISADSKVPTPQKSKDVKEALYELFDKSDINGRSDCLAAVARLVRCESSRDADKSGLQDFIEDARAETGK